MKRKFWAVLLSILMIATFMPSAAFAETAPADVYVSSSGSDSGDGTQASPYATLAKAVEEAEDGATVYVMSDLTMTECARYYNKNLTITSFGDTRTVTRQEGFKSQNDTARSWYNPAMIEVNGSLRLENIIFDDAGRRNEDAKVFAQATTDKTGGNENKVQDAIIASYDGTGRIVLGKGAVLQNFGGMSAVRITGTGGALIMESGSKIVDTTVKNRVKGDSGSVGPAGAVWVQGASVEMKSGSEISNVIGRAVYVDGGKAEIGGTISGITANGKVMWQGDSGTAIHLRNSASGKLTSTALIENISGGGSAVYTNGCDLTAENGSIIKALTNTMGIAVSGECEVYFDGEITGMTGTSNALNLQNAAFHVTIAENANIHDNHVGYGTIYIQAQNGVLDIYGKINNNIASDRGGAIAMGNNFKYPTVVTMYDGAEICNNYSAQTGGGVMVSVGTFTMKGGTISNNLSKMMGGGLYVRRGGNFIMEGGTISGNTTAEYGGGIAYEAGEYNGGVPCVTLKGGTITDNTISATIEKDSSTDKMAASGGVSNDISVLNKDNVYSHINRYLNITDGVTIGNKAVYFQTDNKTVTPADGSLNIKLGNAGAKSNDALKDESNVKGWSDPLATFWMQRGGADTLTAGGLNDKIKEGLPVYAMALPVGEDGNPATDAQVSVYAAEVTKDGIIFTIPEGNDNGYAVALVQPTEDYGKVTVTTTKAELVEDKEKTAYEIPYTATYSMSPNLKEILSIASQSDTFNFTIVLDNCLTAKDDYTLTSPIFEAESVTASADGHKVTAVCKLKAGWKDNIENATEAMALSGTGILEAADFAAGGTVGTTASVQATVVSGDEAIVVCVPGNVCTTSMAAAEPEPVDPTEPSEPVDPSNPTDPSTPADTQDQVNTAEDAPTTGDETSMGLLVGLFMLTVISLAGIIFLRRSSIKK